MKAALEAWADDAFRERAGLLAVGYFGSYASGRPGPGSDLDVVMVVDRSDVPFVRRAAEWDLSMLPVPVDLLVYTRAEWNALSPDSRAGRMLREETVWVGGRRPRG